MRKTADFAWGVLIGLCLVSCAGLSYKYYGLDIPDGCYQEGHLLAHDPKEDLPLSICAPDLQVRGKCIIMQTDEFSRLKTDLLTCQSDLKECQLK